MAGEDGILDRVKSGRFLIGGEWVEPASRARFDVVTPSDETVYASVPCAEGPDIDEAVAAARRAFDHGPWPALSHAERGDSSSGSPTPWSRARRFSRRSGLTKSAG